MDRDERVRQLLRSPGGCAFLLGAADGNLTPKDLLRMPEALHYAVEAVGELDPWIGEHDDRVAWVLEEGPKHRALAEALIERPELEAWWGPADLARQLWLERESRDDFPAEATFPHYGSPPNRNERYVHAPDPEINTSTLVGDQTSQLAFAVGYSDWLFDYPARRKHIRVRPDARIYEVTSAEDWHALVTRHGARCHPREAFNLSVAGNRPWGPNDGLVPDWGAIAREWDGVHITLWAYLIGTQVRVTSDAGWSEAWVWEGETTIWLNWVFEAVEDLEPLAVDAQPPIPSFWIPFPVR